MRKLIVSWLEERTGFLDASRSVLERTVPGGARWGHVLGFTLASTLLVELVTGLLLMTTYSPSSGSAWGSVYYITYQMELGWLVRGLHRYASYGSVVVGGLLLLRLVLSGAYRAPRELSWWIAVGVFLLILVLGVTGNILPWDQRGYWAAVVELTIAGSSPVIGPAIKKVVVGGPEMGNQTLTRIYGLHVLVLPGLLAGLLRGGFALFRKYGYPGRADPEKDEPFWPGQAFYNLAAALGVLGVLVALTWGHHGYSLDAPADPSSDDYPARPEWYFLPLNQLMKVFHGQEMIATMILPGIIVGGLLILPLLEKVIPGRLARIAGSFFVLTVAGCSAYLIYQGLSRDARSPEFQAARAKADVAAARALALASHEGIPPEGSSFVLGRDPWTRGGDLFAKKCQGCHSLGDKKAEPVSAPSLQGFGSFAWIRGLLETPDSPDYFGKVPQCGGMKQWKESSKLNAGELDEVARFVASFAEVPPEVTPNEWLSQPKVKDHPGRKLYQAECAECHTMGDPAAKAKKIQPAPDLFAWGSDQWTSRMIRHPGSLNFYGYLEEEHEQKMPEFAGQITAADVATLVRYLKGDYYRPGPARPSGAVDFVTPASR